MRRARRHAAAMQAVRHWSLRKNGYDDDDDDDDDEDEDDGVDDDYVDDYDDDV